MCSGRFISSVKQQDGHLASNLQRLQICQWIGDLVKPDVVSALCHARSQGAFNTTVMEISDMRTRASFLLAFSLSV